MIRRITTMHVPSHCIILTSNYSNWYWWEFNSNERRRCHRLFSVRRSRIQNSNALNGKCKIALCSCSVHNNFNHESFFVRKCTHRRRRLSLSTCHICQISRYLFASSVPLFRLRLPMFDIGSVGRWIWNMEYDTVSKHINCLKTSGRKWSSVT